MARCSESLVENAITNRNTYGRTRIRITDDEAKKRDVMEIENYNVSSGNVEHVA